MAPRLPADFVWGAATAAYQIEGATAEDGRGESIWDRFTATPGRILTGETGAVACDSYHRRRDDVRLLAELGLTGYRFSIAWPRVLPDGVGRVEARGLDYYDRLVDDLLEHGIEPFATLYHWDLPQALEDRGGWPTRSTVDAFAGYVEVVAAKLGDRVRRWITQNEPWVIARLGYGTGEHAPGRRSEADAVAAGHHVLLSHARAAEVVRRDVPDAQVGIAVDLVPMRPLTGAEADERAACLADAARNRWFLDPLLAGRYPADAPDTLAALLPPDAPDDLPAIAVPLDFLGLNYYRPNVVRADPATGAPVAVELDGVERTGMGWEVDPGALHDLLVRLHRDYDLPAVHVTENGAAYADTLVDGRVDDPERTSYLERHVDAVARAVADGVPVAGYFVWSLLDNFEWSFGYSQRFGLVHVDFETLERVPKASAAWYRDLVARERVHAAAPAA